jgi:hypothetical protein
VLGSRGELLKSRLLKRRLQDHGSNMGPARLVYALPDSCMLRAKSCPWYSAASHSWFEPAKLVARMKVDRMTFWRSEATSSFQAEMRSPTEILRACGTPDFSAIFYSTMSDSHDGCVWIRDNGPGHVSGSRLLTSKDPPFLLLDKSMQSFPHNRSSDVQRCTVTACLEL